MSKSNIWKKNLYEQVDVGNKNEQEAERLENSQLLRKTWHVNQIFELILEQCVANYYRDNTKYNREIIS